jgi:NADP-dependent 3-hydroxy acid dehydrogenase YdfG/AcrR family transcriptional regulator
MTSVQDNIKGKVAIVTGASSGLGESTARHLAARGAKVVLAARRTDRLEKVVAEIREAGGEAIAVATDVAKRADLEALAAATVEAFGRIDVLVNNAGVMPLSPIDKLKVDEWDRTIDVNIKGVLYGIAAVLPRMQAQGSGHIVNVASIAGIKVFTPIGTVYSATKYAVRAISEGLRVEVGNTGIRVTIVSPGAVESELKFGSTDADAAAGVKAFYDANQIPSDSVARAVVYAQKGQQTKAAIVDAALGLATQIGLEGLSIGALAEVTQMSKSGVFAHFGSREELQISVIREYHQRFEQEVFYPALKATARPAAAALHVRQLDEAHLRGDRLGLHLHQRRRRIRRPSRPGARRAGLVGAAPGTAPCARHHAGQGRRPPARRRRRGPDAVRDPRPDPRAALRGPLPEEPRLHRPRQHRLRATSCARYGAAVPSKPPPARTARQLFRFSPFSFFLFPFSILRPRSNPCPATPRPCATCNSCCTKC